MTKGNWIILGIIAVIALSVGGYFLVRSVWRSQLVAPFQAHLSAYHTAANKEASATQGIPPVGAKFVVIDKDSREVEEEVFFSLPEDRRAAKHEEVATIVLIKWDKDQIGTYDGGQGAYVQTGEVRYTAPDGKVVSTPVTFRGSNPPERKKSSQSGTGNKPVEAIVKYLVGLPRS